MYPTPPTEILTAALKYAALGWHVLPLEKNGKRPACKHGWKDATTNPAQIREWFAGSEHNIGIATGLSGLLVVDLDGPEGMTHLGKFPAGPTVFTPRGAHLYYRGSGPSTVSQLFSHVDTRGLGGYVVAPPSVVNGHEYRWLGTQSPRTAPAWLVEALKPRPRPRAKPTAVSLGVPPDDVLTGSLWRLERAVEGTRNHTLNREAWLVSCVYQDATEALDQLADVARSIGLSDHEITRTIASAHRAATTKGK